MAKELKKAVAYLRTSSATNVSKDNAPAAEDKDSDKRQRAEITRFAKAAGYELVDEYYDKAVKGTDPVGERPEFAKMLERLIANGAKTIIVESPDRFARDLMVQLAGHDMLKKRGIDLIAASAPTSLHRGHADRSPGPPSPRRDRTVRQDNARRQAGGRQTAQA